MSELSSDESNGEVRSVLVDSILPAVSKGRYLHVYENFMKWRAENNEKSFSEKVFLAYFNEISKTRKPSSLWGIYSMLKSTMQAKHNLYLKNYTNLLVWLRKRSVGFKSSKSKILTEENVKKFVEEAPDVKYLATKVALIIGVCGACRVGELTSLTIHNIKIVDDIMIGVLFDPNTKVFDKMFAIRHDLIPTVQKYLAMRPEDPGTDRFFLSLRDGQCTRQVVGRHKMASLSKEIAQYLKLPNPECYTGHCFRRSASVFGSIVSGIDKRNKAHSEEFRCSTQQEFVELVEFAKQYKRKCYTRETSAALEVEFMADQFHGYNEDTEVAATEQVHIKTEEIELPAFDYMATEEVKQTPIGEVYVKTEAIELPVEEVCNKTVRKPQTITDEVQIKTEKIEDATDLGPTMAFVTAYDKQTNSQPSFSGRESRSSDIIIEDSDDNDVVDLVHIRSENVNRKTTLKSLREEISQAPPNPHDTNITVAGKNITILFKNCSNVGNVTVNIINK